jgi:hypothetical protein
MHDIRHSDYVFPGGRDRRPLSETSLLMLLRRMGNGDITAYRRGDLFDKRRKLIDAWAAYCSKVETDAGKVVALARARTPR